MYCDTYRNSLRCASSRSSVPIVSAWWIASPVSAVFHGLTMRAPLSEWAARGAGGRVVSSSALSPCILPAHSETGARGECCVVVCERERERGRTGTGKLGQDEDAVALLLARNVLVGDLRTSRRGTR